MLLSSLLLGSYREAIQYAGSQREQAALKECVYHRIGTVQAYVGLLRALC